MEISKNKTKIAVCGLGYVGFPVALLFARAGFQVIGVDRSEDKAKLINQGRSPIIGKEPGLKELIKTVGPTGRFMATIDPAAYKQAEVIIIAVETPVEENREPAYTALKAALESVGQNMRKGTLVIVESTVAPGTMDNLVSPILERESGFDVNKEFYLANCPERLMPGHLLENIENYNRVLGGINKKSSQLAKLLYKNIVKAELQETNCLTAEIVKAGENAYRDVQIAFANEMALLCEAMGADVWRVRELINDCKRRGETRPEALRQMHFPGAGVGGHCLPKDSWLLVYGAKNLIDPKIIPLARKINDFMPRHIFDLLKNAFGEINKPIANSKIAILGYAYAGNSDDSRNTPTQMLMDLLDEAEIGYFIHDAYIKAYKLSLEDIVKDAQALVLMADHDQYKKLKLDKLKKLMKSKPIIIDGRNCFDKDKAKKLGFLYKGVGNI